MDWIGIALFVTLSALLSMRTGLRAASAFTIAAPLTLLFYTMLPATAFVGSKVASLSPILQAAVAGGLFLSLAFIFYLSIPRDVMGSAFPLQAVLSGLAPAIALMVVWLQIPALAALYTLSPLIHSIFGAPYAAFWLLGALLALVLARR